MIRKIPFLIAAVLILSVHVSMAKTPDEFSEEFFSMVKAGKISDGFDKLFIGSEIPFLLPQQMQVLREKTTSALQHYGDVVGYEKIREEKFGKAVVRIVYILTLEKAPLIWELYFYKPKDNWFVGKILFNDQFHGLAVME